MALTAEQIGMIRQDYRLSKDRVAQIEILAQTNGITTAQVRKILWDGGLYPIGPEQVKKAIDLIGTERAGVKVGCGNIRNYIQAFQGMKAVNVRAVFHDWQKDPWGNTDAETEPKQEQPAAPPKLPELGFSGEERQTIFTALSGLFEERRAYAQVREREVEKLREQLAQAEADLEAAMAEMKQAAKLKQRFVKEAEADGSGEE